MVHPGYEIARTPPESVLRRKIRIKRFLNRFIGETYVGRRVKLSYFRRLVSSLPVQSGWKIADVGSGDGLFAFFTATRFPETSVYGLEMNPTEVRVCGDIARMERLENLCFVKGTPQTCEIGEFDLVYCLDVLEHIKDDLGAVRAMYSRIRPGGWLLVHVPNRFFMETDGSLQTMPDEDAWRVNPGHERQGYTPAELRELLTKAGFQVNWLLQTQGRPVAYAHHLCERVRKLLPLRVAVLPIIDLLTWLDRRRREEHGNTVWALGCR